MRRRGRGIRRNLPISTKAPKSTTLVTVPRTTCPCLSSLKLIAPSRIITSSPISRGSYPDLPENEEGLKEVKEGGRG